MTLVKDNQFGLSNEEFKLLYDIVILPLKKEGAKVYIFGSRANGKNHKFSDIDILFELPEGKKLSQGLAFQIKDNAEESRMSCKLDLVDSKDLAESYRSSVNKTKIEI
jgi:predicted nucleotidyltransferase